MPRKLGDTGDFKPKKLPKPKVLGDYKPGTRFSFRVPGDKPKTENDCGNIEIPDYTRNNKGVGRPQGFAVEYSGEQLENYKKQYPRFERAINLIADARSEYDSGNIEYSFCSKQSPTGYWKVTISPGFVQYFIEAGEPLQILCPVPYQILQVESDGESFVWEQLEGGRLAAVDPPDAIDPVLYILDDVRDNRPIRFKVSIKDRPEINDELIIYTTPTSTYDNFSYAQALANPDIIPCRSIPCSLSYNVPHAPPLPRVEKRAYIYFSGTLPVTWSLPTCDTNFLVETIWQQNTTGQYLNVQKFPVTAIRKFIPQFNTHYRILTVFNTYGRISTNPSCTFYITSGINPGSGIAADELLDGISYTKTKSSSITLPLARKLLESSDTINGFSTVKTISSSLSLPLNAKRLEAPIDTYNNISFTTTKVAIQKFNLGGIIIR